MKKLIALLLLIQVVGCTSTARAEIWPSQEKEIAQTGGLDDYQLCARYYGDLFLLRSAEYKYQSYPIVVKEIDKRNLDCRSFPSFSSKKDFMRDWIKNYEASLANNRE